MPQIQVSCLFVRFDCVIFPIIPFKFVVRQEFLHKQGFLLLIGLVSDYLEHHTNASSSFGHKAKAPWPQVRRNKCVAPDFARHGPLLHMECEVDDIENAPTDATLIVNLDMDSL